MLNCLFVFSMHITQWDRSNDLVRIIRLVVNIRVYGFVLKWFLWMALKRTHSKWHTRTQDKNFNFSYKLLKNGFKNAESKTNCKCAYDTFPGHHSSCRVVIHHWNGCCFFFFIENGTIVKLTLTISALMVHEKTSKSSFRTYIAKIKILVLNVINMFYI